MLFALMWHSTLSAIPVDVEVTLCKLHDGYCHQAHIAALEAGSGLTLDCTHPVGVVVRNWAQGKPAALDITVTSPLIKCQPHYWQRRGSTRPISQASYSNCIPLAVDSYGIWGIEAKDQPYKFIATLGMNYFLCTCMTPSCGINNTTFKIIIMYT